MFGGAFVVSGLSLALSRAGRGLMGRGTSNMVFRSNLLDSRLSATILSNARSNSASASGSLSSSWRVTKICSSSSSESLSPFCSAAVADA